MHTVDAQNRRAMRFMLRVTFRRDSLRFRVLTCYRSLTLVYRLPVDAESEREGATVCVYMREGGKVRVQFERGTRYFRIFIYTISQKYKISVLQYVNRGTTGNIYI